MMEFLVKVAGASAVVGLLAIACFAAPGKGVAQQTVGAKDCQEAVSKLTAKWGEKEKARAESGVRAVAALWQGRDGTASEFVKFCEERYIADEMALKQAMDKLQRAFEAIHGRFGQIRRDLNEPLDLDQGKLVPVDFMLAEYSPSAHFSADMFSNKTAFFVMLNFPKYSLNDKLELGPGWDRTAWVKAKLGDSFTSRIPAEVSQKLSVIGMRASNYVSEYNVFAGNLRTPGGKALFPEGLKLLSHWNLRDELKGQYANGAAGLERQETIFRVMERIVDQTIPAAVVNNPDLLWDPVNNRVSRKGGEWDAKLASPEPDTRYGHLLSMFHGQELVDPYVPSEPTLMDRRFKNDRQIPEEQVVALLESVLKSPLAKRVALLVEKRLGRQLRPFDIWYDGFGSRGAVGEAKLDGVVKAKYPTAMAFQKDIPNMLAKLGFSSEQAAFLAPRVVVDPARGSGHAMGPDMRSEQAHLRTRVAEGGMNYKGYDIAVHELGHNVEQVFSMCGMDEYLLSGVPNTAFTECFAFVFQTRGLDLLGLKAEDPAKKRMDALGTFWGTFEIAAVSMVDLRAWKWMYAHPKATPAELKQAVIQIARDVWNQYFSPLFGTRDATIPAIYSHMIDYGLYLPDYPLGHIISVQMERYLEGKNIGKEMERMCRQGSITPRLWMERAIGEDISTAPLLKAAEEALAAVP